MKTEILIKDLTEQQARDWLAANDSDANSNWTNYSMNSLLEVIREIYESEYKDKPQSENIGFSVIVPPKKKFKVLASYSTYVEAIIEADDEDQAYAMAKEMDGGSFIRTGGGDWNIDQVHECVEYEYCEDQQTPTNKKNNVAGP